MKDSKMIFIIKMKQEATVLNDFRNHLIQSKEKNEPYAYYNLTLATSVSDYDIFEKMQPKTEYRCALLDYTADDITHLYWAECKRYEKSGKKSIPCRLLFKTSDKMLIDNFVYNLELDLEKDFKSNSYINYEISEPLYRQMFIYEKEPYQEPTHSITYPLIAEEKSLSDLAQKNNYCCRKYNLRPCENRGEFQRDYDRIIYSKAFRRMVDKAQIFSSIKGDHYRTRMTHTLIVCQIARSISHELKLNTSLAEAISAGHDLGHTPFGHQGERTLNAILTGKVGFEVNNLAIRQGDEKPIYPYGGFKHNYQSARVATLLENQYAEINGIDLSMQTLNGMWMHTDTQIGMNIEEFSDGFLSEGDNFATTLEGQVVAVADEIAQRSHDIDDAFASQLITIDSLIKYLELKKFIELKKQIDEINTKIKVLKDENRLFSDDQELIYTQISSLVVSYFINDVVQTSIGRMKSYSLGQFESDGHTVREKLVWFSADGESLCKYLNKIITKKVINSHEVAIFDQNGSNIILTLFRAYYKNPMLLHDGTLMKIWNEYRKNDINVVDFKEGKPDIVKSEWQKITTTSISINKTKRTPEQDKIIKQRVILVRNICDFISGMTDSYAFNEYHKIVH